MNNLEELFEEENQIDDKFVIDDYGKLDWAINKYAKNQVEIVRIKNYVKGIVDKIKFREAELLKPLVSSSEYLVGMSREFIDAEILHSSKKSVNSLKGSAGLRNSPEKVEIVNMENLVEWVEERKSKIIIKTVLISEVKKIDGWKDAPGIKIKPGDTKYFLKPDDGLVV